MVRTRCDINGVLTDTDFNALARKGLNTARLATRGHDTTPIPFDRRIEVSAVDLQPTRPAEAH
jgi:hypothetical protein